MSPTVAPTVSAGSVRRLIGADSADACPSFRWESGTSFSLPVVSIVIDDAGANR